jgi:DNA-binding MarR family transcriptional regulator
MSHAEVEGGAGYLVKRVQQSLRRRCDAALKPIGLSMAQYAALRALRSAGLVRASESASARGRANALALTPAGRSRLAASHDAVIGVEDAMVQGLSREARHQLASLLARCAENLENDTGGAVTSVGLAP